MSVEGEKQLAADAAAALVAEGMRVGLGTGSTVARLLAPLAARALDIVCVATSPVTERAAVGLGLRVEAFDRLERLDLAIDGADQVAPDGWLVKGRGGAHTREKVVAAAADEFVVIVDSTKLVDALHPPVPVELLSFGLLATVRALQPVVVRGGALTPDGGVLADYHGALDDASSLATHLSSVPGVVGHGLFAPSLVTKVLVGRGDSVHRMTPGGST
ncbi:MAG TPA: ribose 5-phosphate isomerase A [Acidimicrobiales bacterium]